MKNFLSFLMYGGVAASVNLVSRWVLSHWLAYPVAIALAYMLGMLTGFLLFRIFVFAKAKSKNILKESFWYVLINILAFLQTLGVSLLCIKYFFPYIGMSFYPHDVAHVIGVVAPVVTSYFGHKYFTFH